MNYSLLKEQLMERSITDQRDQDQIKLNSQLVQSMSELLQKYSDVVKENKQKEEEIAKLRMEKTVLIDFSFDWN